MTLPTKQATDGLMDDTENSGRPSKRRRASPELTPESLISRSDHENTPEMLPPPAQPQIGPASPPLEPVRKEARKHNADAKREQIVLYTKLLNEEIRLQQSHTIYEQKDTDCPLRSSYISGSWWTTEEKETFFNHLATAGKGRIDKIADAIPTKSIVECRAYLLELEAGLEFYSDNSQRRRRLLTYEDIPAAAEVSEDCTHALDRLAEDLEKRLIHLENRRGFKEFKGLWDWDKALALERQDKEILDIPRLVDLSTDIFMDRPNHLNWQELNNKVKTRKPSILYPALKDFEALVVSLTKRIIQVVLFIADARISALRRTRALSTCVRPNDVFAALKILNLPISTEAYWVGAERKWKMDGAQTDEEDYEEELAAGQELEGRDGEEVENESEGTEENEDANNREEQEHTGDKDVVMDGADSERRTPAKARITSLSSDFVNDPSEDSDSVSTMFNDNLTDTESISSSHYKLLKKQKEFDVAEDAYLEALDSRSSVEEEDRLWGVLKNETMTPPGGFLTRKIAAFETPLPSYKRLDLDLDYGGEDWEEDQEGNGDWTQTYPYYVCFSSKVEKNVGTSGDE